MEPEAEYRPKVNRTARGSSDILADIVLAKRQEVQHLLPRLAELRAEAEAAPATRPFASALRQPGRVVVIGEFKRRSPSAGPLGGEAGPAATARTYEAAGVAALSILTDAAWFGGSLGDLALARAASSLPVLRKDFVVDAVQVYEARAAGADAILLIVRILEDGHLSALHGLAESLGMGVLVEVHDDAELERALQAGAPVIGVNNRDLATFRTDVGISLRLAGSVPPACTLVAESGIRTGEDVDRLGDAGVNAILVGETLMREGGAERLVGRARTERS